MWYMRLLSEILGEVSSERPEYDIEQVAKRLAMSSWYLVHVPILHEIYMDI